MTLSLAGCSDGQKETEAPADKTATEAPAADDTSDADSSADDTSDTGAADAADTGAEADETEEETDASLAPITPSDYLIADASEYVTLGDYDAIPLEQTVYEITDEMVQSRINEELELYGEEKEQDRPIQEGDIVYANVSYTPQSTKETTTDEEFYTTVGYEEYGAEFDQNLTGASAGDTLEFSVSYAEDDMMLDWAGDTVDFKVEITSVCTLELPTYDDTFVQKNYGYNSTAEYESAVREILATEYEENSYSEAAENLLMTAIDLTTFSGYPQELFDSCKEELLSFYTAFIDGDTEQDVYDTFGITKEDFDAEILSAVNRRLLISAYCQENDITITQDEYFSYVEQFASYYGDSDVVSFEENYTRESLVESLYESKVASVLYEKAEITEVTYDPTSEDEFLDAEVISDDDDIEFVEDPDDTMEIFEDESEDMDGVEVFDMSEIEDVTDVAETGTTEA